MVTTKNAGTGRSSNRTRNRRRAAARPTPRPHGHSLAPEHIGEAGSVALLALSILGLALFIAAVAMVVFGLTTAARYGSLPPPNAGALGQGQVMGGVGLGLLGLAVVGSVLALLADVPRSRPVVVGVSALAAVLSGIGVVRVMTLGPGDPVLAGALAICTVVFAAAAIVLARRPR